MSDSEQLTLFKVSLTWGLGMLLASPIPVLAIMDIKNVLSDTNNCEMSNQYFLVIGSLLSFYIPMTIMVTTYILTIHHLKKRRLQGLAGNRHVGISRLVENTLSGLPGGLTPQIRPSDKQQRYFLPELFNEC